MMALHLVAIWLLAQQCVGPEYEPDLGTWDGPSYRQVRGAPDALINLELLFAEMEKRGLKPVLISGYRSYQEQEALHARDPEWTEPAGYSQHQLGTAFDISWMGYGLRQPHAELYTALADLGPKYEFEVTYDGTSDMPSEPWHINFTRKNRCAA